MTAQNEFQREPLPDELRQRMHTFPIPPEGFDPVRAEPRELELYGLPPRPDRELLPKVAQLWDEMFHAPLRFVESRLWLVRAQRRIFRSTTSGRRESSLNWSGAYLTPRNGRQFNEIRARWEIPLVDPPAGRPPGAEYRNSTWIGLDGQRRYFDSSLPQIGTAQFLNAPGEPPFSAWFQWWLRNNPLTFDPIEIEDVPVDAGHVVTASLLVLSETRVKLSIRNLNTDLAFVMDVDAPADAASLLQARVSGATAEWITERPANLAGEHYELPNYHQVDYLGCVAVAARLQLDGTFGPGLEHSVDAARPINMYRVERNPSRSVLTSKAALIAGDLVRTNYVDS